MGLVHPSVPPKSTAKTRAANPSARGAHPATSKDSWLTSWLWRIEKMPSTKEMARTGRSAAKMARQP